MPRYHLNVHNGHGSAIDEEGAEYSNLGAARIAAVHGIRSFLSAEVLDGTLDLNGHLDIVDTEGVVVARVPFSDAVAVRP